MRRAAVAVAVAVLGVVACFPQGQCETAAIDYCYAGDPNCQGHILDATHWESGPIDGNWLQYDPEELITMHLRDAVTGQVLSADRMLIDVYVAASLKPTAGGPLPAPCAGMLCENLQTDSSSFFLKNDTCSPQFVYVMVEIIPTADAGATE